MDHHFRAPCNAFCSFHQKPPILRRLHSPPSINHPYNSYKCRRKTTSGLRTPVSVSGQNDSSYPPSSVPSHKVTVRDRQRGTVYEFFVPEDQYILHTTESQDIRLPFACRFLFHAYLNVLFYYHQYSSLMVKIQSFYLNNTSSNFIDDVQLVTYAGCCTSCAVRVKSGQIRQPEALGISAELKSKGYALLCVDFPSSDVEVETQDEDEVYWLQFGRYFARGPIGRDDIALELAMGDE